MIICAVALIVSSRYHPLLAFLCKTIFIRYIDVLSTEFRQFTNTYVFYGGARGVMVIVDGIGHGDTSSNPGLIAFT